MHLRPGWRQSLQSPDRDAGSVEKPRWTALAMKAGSAFAMSTQARAEGRKEPRQSCLNLYSCVRSCTICFSCLLHNDLPLNCFLNPRISSPKNSAETPNRPLRGIFLLEEPAALPAVNSASSLVSEGLRLEGSKSCYPPAKYSPNPR